LFFLFVWVGMDTLRLVIEGALGDTKDDGDWDGTMGDNDLADGVRDIIDRSFGTKCCNSEVESIAGSSNLGVFLRIDWPRMESSNDVPDLIGAEFKHDVDAFGLGIGVERPEDERE